MPPQGKTLEALWTGDFAYIGTGVPHWRDWLGSWRTIQRVPARCSDRWFFLDGSTNCGTDCIASSHLMMSLAAYLHILGDIVNSIGVIIASIIIWLSDGKLWYVDPICTYLFSLIVFYTTEKSHTKLVFIGYQFFILEFGIWSLDFGNWEL